jgi:hypothetical protein
VTWTEQRRLVNLLSDRATGKRREAGRVGENLKAWMTSYIGSVETLVWLFAAGSFWGAGRSPVGKSSAARRSMIAAFNTSLLAWQLVHRQLELTRPKADIPPEEPRPT